MYASSNFISFPFRKLTVVFSLLFLLIQTENANAQFPASGTAAAAGTYIVPTTGLLCTIECWGGGGGGGYISTSNGGGAEVSDFGGGAGGGAYSKITGLTLSSSQTVVVTIGSGGSGGTSGNPNGNNGTASSVTVNGVTEVSADYGSNSNGGKGGKVANCIGTTKFAGGKGFGIDGGNFTDGGGGGGGGGHTATGGTCSANEGCCGASPDPGGAGGDGATGAGGLTGGGAGGAGGVVGVDGDGTWGNAVGSAGFTPGGGGGGGSSKSTNTNGGGGANGGNGATGQVVFTYVALPIELLSFSSALCTDEHCVNIVWTTASEQNNDYFTIERSTDGKNWSTIGKVQGAGNSNTERSYEFVDSSPEGGGWVGTLYYRLKQTDYNGQSVTYGPISIQLAPIENWKLVIKNPATDNNLTGTLFITEEGNVSLQIMDLQGRIIKTENINAEKGSNLLNIDIGNLERGLYFVKAYNNTNNILSKFVKL